MRGVFFGVVDLLAILPTYLDLLLAGAHYLALLRVLRIFRVLKLAKYIGEANVLMRAMRSSGRKNCGFHFSGGGIGANSGLVDPRKSSQNPEDSTQGHNKDQS
jgi:hypothetical protein